MKLSSLGVWHQTFAKSALAFGLTLGLSHAGLNAQEFPTRPVHVIVPTAAGSLNDTVARLVFGKVGDALGQPFVVENRPGAGGSIGAEFVAKAAADGHTLLVSSNGPIVVNPFVYPTLGYDPVRDFEPVSMLAKVSEVLLVNPSLGVKSLDEFIRLAKARPGQIAYASAGNGSPQHLMMELLQRKAGIELVHVPYKGASLAMQAILGGEVGVLNIGVGLALPHIATGRVVALAKTGQPANEALRDVPALTKFYPDAEAIPWQAVFAPKGTTKGIVAKLNAEIEKALASAEVRTRMRNMDLTPVGGSSDDLARTLRAELELNGRLVKNIGVKLD